MHNRVTFFLSTSTLFCQPIRAQNNTFFCAILNGKPVTFVRSSRGNLPIVRWVSNDYFPPPWTATKRCQEVARRFQINYDNRNLIYINTGTVNGEPVVCAAANKDDVCNSRNLLFTLKRGSDPDATLKRLMDRRGLASGYVLSETGPGSVNLERYLDGVPAEENVTPLSP
ncbi:hypothetical protein BCD67_25290 [Oscillatoriales cyanobacterium USR001]|nr:hypothetical protein BCD67_25290 [Oscillatoriales cyanobacterium USR001]